MAMLMFHVWMRELRQWVRRHLRHRYGWRVNYFYWSDKAWRFRMLFTKKYNQLYNETYSKRMKLEAEAENRLLDKTLNEKVNDLMGVKSFITASVAVSGSIPTPPPTTAQRGSARNHRFVYVEDERAWYDLRFQEKVNDIPLIRMLESTRQMIYNPDTFSPRIFSDFDPGPRYRADYIEDRMYSEVEKLQNDISKYGNIKLPPIPFGDW